jgi:hypothetical protein
LRLLVSMNGAAPVFGVRLEVLPPLALALPQHLRVEFLLDLDVGRSGASYATPGSFGGQTVDVSSWTFELVPGARLSWRGVESQPGLALFAQAGLGAAMAMVSTRTAAPFMGPQTTRSQVGAGVVRLSAGLSWELGQRLQLFGEPVGLSFYSGEGQGVGLSVLFGAALRI